MFTNCLPPETETHLSEDLRSAADFFKMLTHTRQQYQPLLANHKAKVAAETKAANEFKIFLETDPLFGESKPAPVATTKPGNTAIASASTKQSKFNIPTPQDGLAFGLSIAEAIVRKTELSMINLFGKPTTKGILTPEAKAAILKKHEQAIADIQSIAAHTALLDEAKRIGDILSELRNEKINTPVITGYASQLDHIMQCQNFQPHEAGTLSKQFEADEKLFAAYKKFNQSITRLKEISQTLQKFISTFPQGEKREIVKFFTDKKNKFIQSYNGIQTTLSHYEICHTTVQKILLAVKKHKADPTFATVKELPAASLK